MKKRVLSIMLCIVMLVSLLPTTALAVEANGHPEHICGSCSHIDNDPHKIVEASEWTEWTSTTALPTHSAGNYYLTEDITLTNPNAVNLDLTICLNGHTITVESGTILLYKALTITDCAGTGKIVGNSTSGNSCVTVSRSEPNKDGTFNMYGGTITENSASNGGGVFVEYGTFNMYGGTINKNSASSGGGVYVEYGTFNIYGGTITDNSVTLNGGGVYVASGGSARFNMYGGSITNNTSGKVGGGVRTSGKYFTISGSPEITGNTMGGVANNLYLINTNSFTIDGKLDEAAQIGISTATNAGHASTFTSGWNTYMSEVDNYTDYFTSDNNYAIGKNAAGELELKQNLSHCVCGDGTCTVGGHSHDSTIEWTETNSLPGSAGYYYLTSDVTIRERWNAVNGVVLCLNGYSIIMTGDNDVIRVGSGVTFTITDCKTTGKITHASGATDSGVFIYEGTFNMYGGSITGNNGSYGGGVFQNTGTFNMYGGSITDNAATYDGGGVHMESGTFNMYDGSISDNSAVEDGGGVSLNNSTVSVNMSGGNITGNSAAENGGGVYVYNGTFTVSGSPKITDNTKGTGTDAPKNNLHLSSGMKVTVDGTLSEGASIGITKSAGIFSTGGAASIDYFSSDDPTYKVEPSDDNLKLVSAVVSVTGVTLNKDSITLIEGGSETLTATVAPDNATNTAATWASSAPAVATVENGVVSAVGEGTATITVTTADGNFTDTCIVTVIAAHEHPVCGATCGHSTAHEDEQWQPIGTKDELLGISEAGYYYLTASIDLGTDTWRPVDGVVLDLNGNTLSSYADYMIGLNSNIDFTITDCKDTGKISHTKLNESIAVSAYDTSTGFVFTLYNGTIESTGYVYHDNNDNGTFNQYGGSISSSGSHTVFIRYGSGKYNLYGGSVANTDTATNATAVCVLNGNTQLTMSGDVEISAPVGIQISNPITIAGELEKPFNPYTIYPTDLSAAFTSGWDSHMSAADPTDYFAATSYSPGYVAAETSEGELQLVEKPTTVTVLASANPTAGGTVTGAGEYEIDAEVTVIATPATGYTFVNWTENGSEVSTDASYVFTANADRTLVANFEAKTQYTITYTDGEANGAAFTTQIYNVYEGDATPAYNGEPTWTGHTFAGWNPSVAATVTGTQTYVAQWTEKATVSIIETAQPYTWDGNTKSFVISGTPSTDFTVQYKVNGNWTANPPSAVGTYDVKITRAEDNIYKTYEKELSGVLVINAATANYTAPTAKIGLVYDSNAQSLINAGSSEHGHWEYSLDGANYLTAIPTGTDAKTYTVYCRFVPNTGYSNIDTVELSVPIAPMAVDEPTVVGNYTYTGDEQTVELYGVENYMTISGDKGTNAGNYIISITLDANYTWKSGSDGNVQWSIAPATPIIVWPVGTAYVNDENVTLTGGSAEGVGTETSINGSFAIEGDADLSSAGEKTVTITFTPYSTNYESVEKTDFTAIVSKRTVASVADQTPIANAVYATAQDELGLPATVTITTVDGKIFNNVPVTWSGYDATNLSAQTLTGTLDLTDIAAEVQQADPAITASIVVDLQEKNAEAFSFENKTETYSGSPISNEISDGLDGVSSISYIYKGTRETEYAESADAPTNAGTYEVTATFTMEAGYAAVAPKTATLTISPKEVGIEWSDFTAAELVYSGTAKIMTATATGLVDGDVCNVTVELVGDNVNVGGFHYNVTGLSNENYNLPTEVSSPELTITPKTLTITAEDKEAYVGSRQPELTYTVEGLVGNDTLTTEPTLTTDANMNRAGTYTITFALDNLASVGGNYSINYVDGTLTVKNYPYIPQPTYDVEIADDIIGGEVSASKKLASKGDTVTITIAPNAGYELTALTVTDSRGNTVSVTKISDGKYTFKMPGYDVEVDAVFAKIDTTCPRDWTCPMYGYTDLDRSLWYHDGIHYCIEHGLMQGVGNNKFDPNGTTTRAMIVTILWRLEGSPARNYAMDFEDVPADQWYTEAIRWAASEKIVEGYGDGKFGTNDAITREQMVTIMFRYAKYKGCDVSVGENTNILSYDDAFDVAEWAIPAMQWACGSGMIQGIADGNKMNLVPQGNATRAQAAAILQRYVENVAVED